MFRDLKDTVVDTLTCFSPAILNGGTAFCFWGKKSFYLSFSQFLALQTATKLGVGGGESGGVVHKGSPPPPPLLPPLPPLPAAKWQETRVAFPMRGKGKRGGFLLLHFMGKVEEGKGNGSAKVRKWEGG